MRNLFRLPVYRWHRAFERILAQQATPATGENLLGALTAGERTHWARTRKDFFSRGVNKTSLHCIEKAAFVVVLDDVDVMYDKASTLLHTIMFLN